MPLAACCSVKARFPKPRAMLSRGLDLSERQAYRYLKESSQLDRPVEVSEDTVPVTLKLPPRTVELLRKYARCSGLISALQMSRCCELPDAPGVYLILRPSASSPDLLDESPAGHFKGQDPTFPISGLKNRWSDWISLAFVKLALSGPKTSMCFAFVENQALVPKILN